MEEDRDWILYKFFMLVIYIKNIMWMWLDDIIDLERC